MNFKEIKPFSSIKYEFKGSKKYNVPPLYLKGMFSTIINPNSGEPSTFIGFVNGKNKAQQLHVYFTNTDKTVIEKHKNDYNLRRNIVYVNINHLSATRLPANISGTLKKICMQYAKYYETQLQIKKLKEEENKELNKFNTIFDEVNNKYTKELKEDKSQYSPRDHVDKLIEMIHSNMGLDWGSRGEYSFYMRNQLETRFSFSNLPDGFYGYREYDGQTMLDVPDNPTDKIITYLKGKPHPNYKKLYNIFNSLNSSIKKEKYKTFTVNFEATLETSYKNDETANIEYGLSFKIIEYSDKTYKEMSDFISKYEDTLNRIYNL